MKTKINIIIQGEYDDKTQELSFPDFRNKEVELTFYNEKINK